MRRHSIGCVFERDLEIVTEIGAALGRRPARAAAAAAKHVAETKQVAENVFDSTKAGRAPRAGAGGTGNSRMTESIVTLPLFPIRQHTVSLSGFLELLFRGAVVRILVRVVL